MSVLVTGAAGFIGSHLVRRLVEQGADVTVALRKSTDPWRLDGVLPSVRRVDLDLEDPDSVRTAVAAARPSTVYHLAAWASGRSAAADPEAWTRSFRINTLGTLHVLEALATGNPAARFLRAGGMEEYGDGPAPFLETQRERAVSPYSASQIAATQMSHAFGAAHGLAVATVRPALVYGPRQDPSFFLPGCVRAAVAGDDFEMTEGTQSVDFIYVDDVIDAFLRAAEVPGAAGEILNIGSGEDRTVRSVAELIYERTASRGRLKFGARPGRAAEAPRRFLDTAKAQQLLGTRPLVPLAEGIDRCIAFARNAP